MRQLASFTFIMEHGFHDPVYLRTEDVGIMENRHVFILEQGDSKITIPFEDVEEFLSSLQAATRMIRGV